MKDTIYYFVLFIIYSYMGWMYESILISVREKRVVNRGFLNGPLCPIYGSGAVLVIFFLGEIHNPLLVFALGVGLTGILEYLTSYVMELLFHAKWWDYSERKFNIHGRVCLLGAFVFGVMTLLAVYIVNPIITGVVLKVDYEVIYILAMIVFVVLFTDFCFTVSNLFDLNERLEHVQSALNNYYESSKEKGSHLIEESKLRGTKIFTESKEKKNRIIEESKIRKDKIKDSINDSINIMFEESEYYSDKIKKILNLKKFQDKRIMMAFPHFKSTKYYDAFEKLKEAMRKNAK